MTHQGLIWTFEGRVGICVVLMVLGAGVCLVLTILAAGLRSVSDLALAASALRGGHALTHGLAQSIARKRTTGWWFRLFAAVCVGPPFLALVAVMSVEIFGGMPWWVWLMVGLGGLMGLAAWVTHRVTRDKPVAVAPPVVAGPPAPMMTQPGWSIPADVEQWDR